MDNSEFSRLCSKCLNVDKASTKNQYCFAQIPVAAIRRTHCSNLGRQLELYCGVDFDAMLAEVQDHHVTSASFLESLLRKPGCGTPAFIKQSAEPYATWDLDSAPALHKVWGWVRETGLERLEKTSSQLLEKVNTEFLKSSCQSIVRAKNAAGDTVHAMLDARGRSPPGRHSPKMSSQLSPQSPNAYTQTMYSGPAVGSLRGELNFRM